MPIANRNPGTSGLLPGARRLIAVVEAVFLCAAPALAQKSSHDAPATGAPGVEIVLNNGEPELRVGGVPFFVHGAQFDYFRIPHDLWAHSLVRYRDLGINTIDIRIPWNWHEPRDAEFDFDGRTNPNRNLVALLNLIAQMRFKLIVRPGPVTRDDWRNAGIPAWLLTHPEYGLSAAEIQHGIAPPDATLAARDSNAAARFFLANEIHMTYARRWLVAVAKVLAPYSARKMISVSDPDDKTGMPEAKQIPGPLLFIVLDDGVLAQQGADMPDFARYLDEFHKSLASGGLDAISYVSMFGAAEQGLALLSTSLAANNAPIQGVAGQWIYDPKASPRNAGLFSPASGDSLLNSLLTTADASSLSSLARTLAAQREFPPFLSAFSATTFAPADDTRAAEPARENTLLASRILLGNGIRAIVYAPLQDTLTPTGWETPTAARYFRWDAPLDLAGNLQPRAIGVSRNGQFISAWGAMLAASHMQSDFRNVGLRAASQDADSNLMISQLVSNDATDPNAPARKCAEKQLCARALISVTNLYPDQVAETSFEIRDPTSTGTTRAQDLPLEVTIPARDSLLLPVHAPLCSSAAAGEKCSDEVILAGAELLGVQREGKTLELSFYTPARESVRLHLESAPSKVELDEDYRAESEWKEETRELDVQLPRGSSPDYKRVLRIHLRYTPHVMEKPDPDEGGFKGMEYEVFDAMRFPLGPDVTIPTSPPLVSADLNSGDRLIIAAHNLSDDPRTSDFSLDGAFHGTGFARVAGDEQQITRMKFQPSRPTAASNFSAASPDGLLLGQLSIHSGHEREAGPVLFHTASDAENSHYRYDFDRDGSPEWVLESSRLRLIVSPAYSGRALALVDKSTNDELISLGGALHDFVICEDAKTQDAAAAEDFAFNQGYEAQWVGEKADTSLRLAYPALELSLPGIHVEKTLHFTKPETIEASYRVSFAPRSADAASGTGSPKSFISELSIPVVAGDDGTSQYCWPADSSSAARNPLLAANSGPETHCENIISGGAPILVPEVVARLEIRSPVRHSLAVEWTAVHVVIVPKMFSAEIRFVIPVPRGPAPPAEFTLRYTAEDAP